MRLENILALTHANLVNEPFVSNFDNIVIEVSKVKRGDLFIAFDPDDIPQAILSGAYGIIFDKPTQISDVEIAWIQVKDTSDALLRLIRFRLIEKEPIVYKCDEIILKLALQVMTESSFIVLHKDIKSLFKTLWHIEEKTILLFCPTLLNEDIFTHIKPMPTNSPFPIEVMEQTLFETSFIYDNIFYERQLLSPFFIPYLEQLLHLYKTLKINFRLRKFIPIEHFEAVFVNNNFEIKEFGTSDKVLIFEPNSLLIEKEMKFLKNYAPWAKTIYLLPSTCHKQEGVFLYENSDDIVNILKKQNFHFALIVGESKSILNKPIISTKQLTLDF